MAVAPPKAEAVAQATVPPPKGPGDEAKEQGNTHFKAKEYLKAAASYTKAIKAEPENHVFFSNRSQAFLKLSKVTKALEDADKCIALAPTFVKGYHRKASALHALGEAARTEEAVVVLQGLPTPKCWTWQHSAVCLSKCSRQTLRFTVLFAGLR